MLILSVADYCLHQQIANNGAFLELQCGAVQTKNQNSSFLLHMEVKNQIGAGKCDQNHAIKPKGSAIVDQTSEILEGKNCCNFFSIVLSFSPNKVEQIQHG